MAARAHSWQTLETNRVRRLLSPPRIRTIFRLKAEATQSSGSTFRLQAEATQSSGSTFRLQAEATQSSASYARVAKYSRGQILAWLPPSGGRDTRQICSASPS